MNDSNLRQEAIGLSVLRVILGLLPLMMGLAIACFVARELLGFYRSLEANTFITAMEERFRETTLFVFSGESLQVTEQGASILAFALFIILVVVAAHYALRFILAGIGLMTKPPEAEVPRPSDPWKTSGF